MPQIERSVPLHVEDDDAPAYMFQMALRDSRMFPQLFRVTDGAEATAFLSQTDRYSDAPRPHLVLLDVNLPGKSGFDVLAEMKANSRLRDIPLLLCSVRPC
jgi:chemotaxis family two-component system response regulator Rcp1